MSKTTVNLKIGETTISITADGTFGDNLQACSTQAELFAILGRIDYLNSELARQKRSANHVMALKVDDASRFRSETDIVLEEAAEALGLTLQDIANTRGNPVNIIVE